MNPRTKVVSSRITDRWLCLSCHENTVFERKTSSGETIVEGILFLAGLAIAAVFSFAAGAFIVALSVIIAIISLTGNKKKCPSCGGTDLVPATSPAARQIRAK